MSDANISDALCICFCLVELSAVAHFPSNSLGLNSTLIVRSIQVEFTNIANISDAFCIRVLA